MLQGACHPCTGQTLKLRDGFAYALVKSSRRIGLRFQVDRDTSQDMDVLSRWHNLTYIQG